MCKKLTIVVLSYNHGDFISELLSRVLILSDIADILVIDDASTDDTKNILLSNYSSSVNCIIKEKNKGLIDSHQIWMKLVNTEYVYLIASDDLINVSEFKRAYEYTCNSEVDAIIFDGVNFDEKSKWPLYTNKHKRFFQLPIDKQKIEIFTNHPSPILIQSTIFRTNVLRDIEAFDGKVKFDDYPTFIKLILKGQRFKVEFNNQFFIVEYRHHGSNTYKDYEKMYLMFLEVYNTYCEDSKIKNKSIALVWWLYLARSIKSCQIGTLMKMLKLGKLSYGMHIYSFIRGVLAK